MSIWIVNFIQELYIFRYKASKYIAVIMITLGIIMATFASAKDVVSDISLMWRPHMMYDSLYVICTFSVFGDFEVAMGNLFFGKQRVVSFTFCHAFCPFTPYGMSQVHRGSVMCYPSKTVCLVTTLASLYWKAKTNFMLSCLNCSVVTRSFWNFSQWPDIIACVSFCRSLFNKCYVKLITSE